MLEFIIGSVVTVFVIYIVVFLGDYCAEANKEINHQPDDSKTDTTKQ